MFCKKGVLRNFANFTGKHLYQSLIFVKLAGLRPVTISKMRLAQAFSFQLCEIFKNTYLYRTPPVAASENLKSIVIFSKHVVLCFCVLPAQLLDVIRSGTLLCGVTTRNGTPIPSSTRNRNSTRVGALMNNSS